MANKKERPVIENPLANMGLDEIVREITQTEEEVKPVKETVAKPRKTRQSAKKIFEKHLDQYIGISEQGAAIWLPKEVKKKLEIIRANAERNVPLRSLAAAIIMSYLEENEDIVNDL